VAAQDLRDHLLAVDDEPHGLPHAHVVERRPVHPHGERQPRAGLRLEHTQAGIGLDDVQLAQRKLIDRVDLPAEQRVDPGGVVREVDDDELVQVGLALAPVVRVPYEDALLSRFEAPQRERPGTDRVLRVIPGWNNAVLVLRELVEEDRVRSMEDQLDGPVVPDLDSAGVDRGQPRSTGLGGLRIDDALERVHDVVRRHRLAVVELHALAQPDGPLPGIRRRLDRLGQSHLDAVSRVVRDERVVELDHTCLVRVRHRAVGVQGVLGRPTHDAHLQPSTPAR
jgi:hypothetical protein